MWLDCCAHPNYYTHASWLSLPLHIWIHSAGNVVHASITAVQAMSFRKGSACCCVDYWGWVDVWAREWSLDQVTLNKQYKNPELMHDVQIQQEDHSLAGGHFPRPLVLIMWVLQGSMLVNLCTWCIMLSLKTVCNAHITAAQLRSRQSCSQVAAASGLLDLMPLT